MFKLSLNVCMCPMFGIGCFITFTCNVHVGVLFELERYESDWNKISSCLVNLIVMHVLALVFSYNERILIVDKNCVYNSYQKSYS